MPISRSCCLGWRRSPGQDPRTACQHDSFSVGTHNQTAKTLDDRRVSICTTPPCTSIRPELVIPAEWKYTGSGRTAGSSFQRSIRRSIIHKSPKIFCPLYPPQMYATVPSWTQLWHRRGGGYPWPSSAWHGLVVQLCDSISITGSLSKP